MTNYLETKISEIRDADFHRLIAELCECLNWHQDEFQDKSLANLFTNVVTENKKLDLKNVLISRVLTLKVKDLAPDSAVKNLCCELVGEKGIPMDDLAGKSVFALVKHCYQAVCPAKLRPRKPTRQQMKHQSETALVLRRRCNDSYY
jgi:hypothetical protein